METGPSAEPGGERPPWLTRGCRWSKNSQRAAQKRPESHPRPHRGARAASPQSGGHRLSGTTREESPCLVLVPCRSPEWQRKPSVPRCRRRSCRCLNTGNRCGGWSGPSHGAAPCAPRRSHSEQLTLLRHGDFIRLATGLVLLGATESGECWQLTRLDLRRSLSKAPQVTARRKQGT